MDLGGVIDFFVKKGITFFLRKKLVIFLYLFFYEKVGSYYLSNIEGVADSSQFSKGVHRFYTTFEEGSHICQDRKSKTFRSTEYVTGSSLEIFGIFWAPRNLCPHNPNVGDLILFLHIPVTTSTCWVRGSEWGILIVLFDYISSRMKYVICNMLHDVVPKQ